MAKPERNHTYYITGEKSLTCLYSIKQSALRFFFMILHWLYIALVDTFRYCAMQGTIYKH